jgi:UDPglucose--hexose-1-phosphate uridylyltransferase
MASGEAGICRVICFSPQHDLTIARMSLQALGKVVDVWTAQYIELGNVGFINHVQIFENRGAMMGCSNPHPHCQVWANQTLPNEPAKEQAAQFQYMTRHGRCLLCDYLELERQSGERIIFENEAFVALVPFWAVWPFEALVVAKQHAGCLAELDSAQRRGLADVLKRITTRYDNLFETEFPYSMGFHQKPTDGEAHPEWHMHLHFFPPLLRSATVRKYMVGYELLGAPQRDITAESAAARMRETSEVHYLEP